ncbi:hypothetical protein Zmor_024166 [Zophobas morio]|uniref:Uncharacterized protein n=1 Tax=Zophobas morio TaxID=2755281 RepID=A0AA38M831_9CUCU|nr:hypothetical protein Zmor_024166 [Zophobas morio]
MLLSKNWPTFYKAGYNTEDVGKRRKISGLVVQWSGYLPGKRGACGSIPTEAATFFFAYLHYKETVIKTMWNKTVKLYSRLLYCNKFNRVIDPFKDLKFKS